MNAIFKTTTQYTGANAFKKILQEGYPHAKVTVEDVWSCKYLVQGITMEEYCEILLKFPNEITFAQPNLIEFTNYYRVGNNFIWMTRHYKHISEIVNGSFSPVTVRSSRI